MSEILSIDQQDLYFGRIFHGGGCYGCKFIQIVGYTPKRAIVRSIPNKNLTDRSNGYVDGGTACVDLDWLQANPIPYRATSAQADLSYYLMQFDLYDEGSEFFDASDIFALKKGTLFSGYFSLVKDPENQTFTWCDY